MGWLRSSSLEGPLSFDSKLQLLVLFCAIACADSAAGNGLEESPTWRVIVFFVLFLVLSILVEMTMHHSKHFCEHHNWIGVLHAIHKIEEELMLLGFISLMLLVIEEYIADICIADDPWWTGIKCPCHMQGHDEDKPAECRAGKYEPSSPGRRLLAGDGPSHDCSPGTAPIIEINAMHQVHLLIFLIAVFHVTFSLTTLLVSKMRINYWTGWEFWGDSADETVDRLQPPRKYKSPAEKFFSMFLKQFYASVDPFSYIAFRRYYISKMELPDSFIFKDRVMRSLQNDFKSVVGVSPWMWIILIVHLFLEGSGAGKYYVFTIVSVILVMSAGTKMLYISHRIALGIMLIYDEEADGKIEQSDLDRIQKEGQSSEKLGTLEPGFWFGSPKFLMQCIRFALFSSAVTVAEAVFYRWQVGTNACYFKDRSSSNQDDPLASSYGFPTAVVCMAILAIMVVALLGLIMVPLYSVVNTAGHHFIAKDVIANMFAAHGGHHGQTHPEGEDAHDGHHDGGHETHSVPAHVVAKSEPLPPINPAKEIEPPE
jgi:mlo protein